MPYATLLPLIPCPGGSPLRAYAQMEQNKRLTTSVGGQSVPCNREKKNIKGTARKNTPHLQNSISKSTCQSISVNELHSRMHKDHGFAK